MKFLLSFFFNMGHFYSLLLNLLLYYFCLMFLVCFFFFLSVRHVGSQLPALEDEVSTTVLNFFFNHSLKRALVQTHLHHCLT